MPPKKGTNKYEIWKKSDKYKIFIENQTGSNNWSWKPKIDKICPECGIDFEVRPSKKNQEGCGTECRLKLLSKRMKQPKTQAIKDKISQSHMGIHAGEKNPMFGKHHSTKTKDKISKAVSGEKHPWYGKKNPDHAEKMRGKGNPMFGKKRPDTIEQNKKRIGEKHPLWQDGISFEPYTPEFNRQLKAIIRRRDGYKCQKCNCPEIENTRKLAIHHIDYRKENCLPENLIALCDKCNATVNFNRPHWTEYFTKRVKEIMKSPLQLHLNYEISKKEVVQSP